MIMKTTINHELMRKNNKSYILAYIRKNGPVSKKELADQLVISITSVTTFINELIHENKVVPCGNAKSTGGRKSELFKPNPDAFYVIGCDLQVDRLVTVLINFNGDRLASSQHQYEHPDEWKIAELLNGAIRQICADNRIPPEKLAGIGISLPGVVNHATGVADSATQLDWKHVDLRSLLHFKLPVLIENEANAGVVGESYYGIAKGLENVIYISAGKGIGAGLMLNQRLYYGQNHLAGEFGHLIIEPDGLPCPCGKDGCWVRYASTHALLRSYLENSGIDLQSYEQFLAALSQQDPFALQAVEEVGKYLGLGIANLINSLNPEMILLGGEITGTKEYIYPSLLRAVKKYSPEEAFKGVTIQFTSLGIDSAALGVAGMMIEELIG
jgi:predicted NBD/HSP70 family sugar kinase